MLRTEEGGRSDLSGGLFLIDSFKLIHEDQQLAGACRYSEATPQSTHHLQATYHGDNKDTSQPISLRHLSEANAAVALGITEYK